MRSRVLWLILRLPYARRLAWRRGILARLLGPLIGRGTVQVLGHGPSTRLLLDSATIDPAGAQALAVMTGWHETQVQEALMRSAAGGDAVWDVGANIGFISLVAARIVGPEGRVVAIEPDPACARAVRRNASLNHMGQIHVVEVAAGAGSGETELIVTDDRLWSRLATVGEHEREAQRLPVAVLALDELEGRPPAVVKIDVEGAELDVIAGMRRTLREVRPLVICEMHGRNAEFCDLMTSLRYSVVNLDGPTPVREAADNVHAFCVPSGQ